MSAIKTHKYKVIIIKAILFGKDRKGRGDKKCWEARKEPALPEVISIIIIITNDYDYCQRHYH